MKASQLVLTAAMATIVSLTAAGCAATRTKESTGQYIDDTTLTTKVKAELLKDPQVSGLSINVETFKGTVQLSGFANNMAERRRAVELARAVKGVESVKDDIVIK